MKCPNCGCECKDSAAFCSGCGTKLCTPMDGIAPVPDVYVASGDDTKPLSMWDFFLMEFLSKLPIANLVIYLVWSFSGNVNQNRKHWSQANLIWIAVRICFGVLAIVTCAFFSAVIFSSLDHLSSDMANMF